MRLILKAWVLFFRVSKLGPCFTAIEEDGGDKRLVQLELACEADGVAQQTLFNLAFAAVAEAVLMQASAEQVPSLHRVTHLRRNVVHSRRLFCFQAMHSLFNLFSQHR